MPLKRTFDGQKVVTTVRDGYADHLARWSDIQEYMPFLGQMAALRARMCSGTGRPRKITVLELGARRGNSTLSFLAAIEGTGSHLWSSDLDDILRYPDGMRRWKDHPQWTFVQGDDMDLVIQEKLPQQVDVLFIDTSHEYEHTLNECRAYVPRVRRGGIALFHDTHLKGWPGYTWDGEKAPVWQALDDYCAETGLEWSDKEGVYGLGIIEIA